MVIGTLTISRVSLRLGRNEDAMAWARRAVVQRDPTMSAYGRERLLPVERLKQPPEHAECMREVNWTTDPYVHVTR